LYLLKHSGKQTSWAPLAAAASIALVAETRLAALSLPHINWHKATFTVDMARKWFVENFEYAAQAVNDCEPGLKVQGKPMREQARP
jgi:hypothetical protein